MKRLDNKGQSLVMFILLIPIMLGVMALVIDCGNVMVRKNEIGNVIEMVLDYGFAIDKGTGDTGAGNVDTDTGVDSDINDDEQNSDIDNDTDNVSQTDGQVEDVSDNNMDKVADLKRLLDYNLKTSHNEVSFDGSKILIKSETYVEGVFAKVFGFKGFKIESEYVGYRDNARVIKEKIK